MPHRFKKEVHYITLKLSWTPRFIPKQDFSYAKQCISSLPPKMILILMNYIFPAISWVATSVMWKLWPHQRHKQKFIHFGGLKTWWACNLATSSLPHQTINKTKALNSSIELHLCYTFILSHADILTFNFHIFQKILKQKNTFCGIKSCFKTYGQRYWVNSGCI